MKANELRIGNWYNQFGNFHVVSIETIKTLLTSSNDQVWCKPIPLTPEILEKCGFKKDGKYNSANRWMGIFNQPLIECNGYVTIPNYTLNEIKYLHQLQNLYFALTGEELEVNL